MPRSSFFLELLAIPLLFLLVWDVVAFAFAVPAGILPIASGFLGAKFAVTFAYLRRIRELTVDLHAWTAALFMVSIGLALVLSIISESVGILIAGLLISASMWLGIIMHLRRLAREGRLNRSVGE